MSREQFVVVVEEAIATLPEWVRTKLENVAFLVDDAPTKLQNDENGLDDDETLFGLYEGVPLSERGNTEVLMPDRITIFMKPILETYQNEDEVWTGPRLSDTNLVYGNGSTSFSLRKLYR